MFIKIQSHHFGNHVFECDRFSWETAYGDAASVSEEVSRHLEPCCDQDGEPHTETVKVGGVFKHDPTQKHTAALLTLCRRDKPTLCIAAYACMIYVMNDSGATIDKIHVPAAS